MSISSHVLDTSSGRPASGVRVTLERRDGDTWSSVTTAQTDSDGRVPSLAKDSPPATYRLRFDVADYFKGVESFYPYVEIVFTIRSDEHHHVPLLISPFGYTTYRGS